MRPRASATEAAVHPPAARSLAAMAWLKTGRGSRLGGAGGVLHEEGVDACARIGADGAGWGEAGRVEKLGGVVVFRLWGNNG